MAKPTLKNRNLGAALDALHRLLQQCRTPRLALRVQRACRATEAALGDLDALEIALLDRNGALKDEKGYVPKVDEHGSDIPGTYAFNPPEAEAVAAREQQALYDEAVELDCLPIPLSWLEAAGVELPDGRGWLVLAELIEDDTNKET